VSGRLRLDTPTPKQRMSLPGEVGMGTVDEATRLRRAIHYPGERRSS
jgi:hypothetical protein